MQTRYFKRYRMEIDLQQCRPPRAILPEGYRWEGWHPQRLLRHAIAKHESFGGEMDTHLFESLGTLTGCQQLMRGISTHIGFLPQATWLITFNGNADLPSVPCGTIQGLAHSTTLGSIQNVGIIPEHRGCGLGRALVLKALAGFRAHGLIRVYLEVTAENIAAVELYHSVGFERVSTSYRELPETPQPLSR